MNGELGMTKKILKIYNKIKWFYIWDYKSYVKNLKKNAHLDKLAISTIVVKVSIGINIRIGMVALHHNNGEMGLKKYNKIKLFHIWGYKG